MQIRKAAPRDSFQLLKSMRDLAEFEGYLPNFMVTEQELENRLFKHNNFQCLVAEKNGDISGHLVYYPIAFTYDLTQWLFIKELFVKQADKNRRQGVGQALMHALITEAQTLGSKKIKWEVLSSNINAQAFYRQLGAVRESNWQIWSMGERTLNPPRNAHTHRAAASNNKCKF